MTAPTPRTKEQILSDIEVLLVEYMVAETELTTVILDGYVMKLRAIDVSPTAEGQQQLGVTCWVAPESQDIFKSMGLASALDGDVNSHYQYMIETSTWLNENDEED